MIRQVCVFCGRLPGESPVLGKCLQRGYAGSYWSVHGLYLLWPDQYVPFDFPKEGPSSESPQETAAKERREMMRKIVTEIADEQKAGLRYLAHH